MRIEIYRFIERMPVFMDLARESYVGPRVYPLAAFLYAVMNAKSTDEPEGLSQDMGTFLRVRDMITEFTRDRYFMEIIRNKTYTDMDDTMDVPSRILRNSFTEIIRGADYMEDIAVKWVDEFPHRLHHFKVVPDLTRGVITVVRR